MLLLIIMVVFGLIALAKGEFKITNGRKVKGSTGRTLGVLLLLGAFGAFLPQVGGFVQIGTFILVIIIGLIASEKIEPVEKQVVR